MCTRNSRRFYLHNHSAVEYLFSSYNTSTSLILKRLIVVSIERDEYYFPTNLVLDIFVVMQKMMSAKLKSYYLLWKRPYCVSQTKCKSFTERNIWTLTKVNCYCSLNALVLFYLIRKFQKLSRAYCDGDIIRKTLNYFQYMLSYSSFKTDSSSKKMCCKIYIT